MQMRRALWWIHILVLTKKVSIFNFFCLNVKMNE